MCSIIAMVERKTVKESDFWCLCLVLLVLYINLRLLCGQKAASVEVNG